MVKEGVRKETKDIFQLAPSSNTDLRPRAWCSRTKRSFLVDSGAAVSVVPRGAAKHLEVDGAVSLKAVNGSLIPTYGKQTFRLQLGQRAHFTHTFLVADLPIGILGWDFIQKFALDLKWNKSGHCKLQQGNKSISLSLADTKPHLLGIHIAEVA